MSDVYPGVFGVKLPPYFDPVHFDQMAAVLNAFPRLRFVTCINSIGNGLVIDPERECVVIKPKDGLGGLGGAYVPTALANVREFVRRLPDKHVVGCGGISSGREAFMHILAGATAVQIGTCLYEEGKALLPAFCRSWPC
jgi:dihydroorotate dehydrogenase (fumarate)